VTAARYHPSYLSQPPCSMPASGSSFARSLIPFCCRRLQTLGKLSPLSTCQCFALRHIFRPMTSLHRCLLCACGGSFWEWPKCVASLLVPLPWPFLDRRQTSAVEETMAFSTGHALPFPASFLAGFAILYNVLIHEQISSTVSTGHYSQP
jgi:hypothetical protein